MWLSTQRKSSSFPQRATQYPLESKSLGVIILTSAHGLRICDVKSMVVWFNLIGMVYYSNFRLPIKFLCVAIFQFLQQSQPHVDKKVPKNGTLLPWQQIEFSAVWSLRSLFASKLFPSSSSSSLKRIATDQISGQRVNACWHRCHDFFQYRLNRHNVIFLTC